MVSSRKNVDIDYKTNKRAKKLLKLMINFAKREEWHDVKWAGDLLKNALTKHFRRQGGRLTDDPELSRAVARLSRAIARKHFDMISKAFYEVHKALAEYT